MIQSHPLFGSFRHRKRKRGMWAIDDSLATPCHISFDWLIHMKRESDWFKRAIPLRKRAVTLTENIS